jgi:hypothetical protein
VIVNIRGICSKNDDEFDSSPHVCFAIEDKNLKKDYQVSYTLVSKVNGVVLKVVHFEQVTLGGESQQLKGHIRMTFDELETSGYLVLQRRVLDNDDAVEMLPH